MRPSEFELLTPAVRRWLSRWTVLAAKRERRAGIAGRQLEQIAVGGRREVARRGRLARAVARSAGSSRSVPVMSRSRSALPVTFQCHCALVAVERQSRACALSVLVLRASGSSKVSPSPISERPSLCSSSVFSVADTSPRTCAVERRRRRGRRAWCRSASGRRARRLPSRRRRRLGRAGCCAPPRSACCCLRRAG